MTPEEILEDMAEKCFGEYSLKEGYDWKRYKQVLEPQFEVHIGLTFIKVFRHADALMISEPVYK